MTFEGIDISILIQLLVIHVIHVIHVYGCMDTGEASDKLHAKSIFTENKTIIVGSCNMDKSVSASDMETVIIPNHAGRHRHTPGCQLQTTWQASVVSAQTQPSLRG